MKRPNKSRNFAALAVLLLIGAAAPMVQAQGTLVAWGNNSSGVVTGVPAGNFIDVAAGYSHAVALRANGTLVSWGDDSVGQVSGTPTGSFARVFAGADQSIAIRPDGTLIAWGGHAPGVNEDGGTFLAAAGGYYHTVALRTDGTLVNWGDDGWGYLTNTPAGQYVAVAAGPYHSVAIRSDGTLVQWGHFSYALYEYDVPYAGTFSAVASNFYVGVGIRTDGTLAQWTNWTPPGVPAGAYTAVATGISHYVALRNDGALVSWGDNAFGQVTATPAGTFVKVTAGGDFSLAISTSAPQTAAERIEALQVQVHELMQAGTLSQGNGRALLAKLDAAHRSLARGDIQAAVGEMSAFRNQVAAFVGVGTLTQLQGNSLDEEAQAILSVMGS